MADETLAMHAERLARRVLDYVGDDEIDEFMDADIEMQVMARAMLVRLGLRPPTAVAPTSNDSPSGADGRGHNEGEGK